MVNYEFIGARIREARLRKKLSQEQLAAMVDVGTSHISHIETGAVYGDPQHTSDPEQLAL